MTARALDRRGERHLVLDYLLRVPMRTLVERYGVPRPTVYRILARHDVTPERKAP